MEEAPRSPYIEVRDGGYYVAGTRIGLDVIVHEFQSGRSPERFFKATPRSDHSRKFME
jgi:hypothetical protein